MDYRFDIYDNQVIKHEKDLNKKKNQLQSLEDEKAKLSEEMKEVK